MVQLIVFEMYGGWNSARLFNDVTVAYIFILLVFFSNRLNIDVFYRNYVIVASIASAAIVIQAFQLYVLGQPVYGIALLPCDTSSWFDGERGRAAFSRSRRCMPTTSFRCFSSC